MAKMGIRHGSSNGRPRTRNTLLYLMAALSVLGLGYVASRTLPLATPAFGEWAYHVVSSGGNIQRLLSTEARRKVEFASAQQRVDEDTNLDFGPLLDAFEEAETSPGRIWPTRTHEVSVSVGGKQTVIVAHCVIEWFGWRVADISEGSA